MAPLRWAIVSAGKISSDFVSAVNILPKEDHQVVAVATRSLDTAQQFAKKFNIPRAYGSYDKLVDDKDIDVVYIGAINPTHFGLLKMFINAGYPVLCEKPITMNAKELKEIIKLAREKNVFLMEAFWTRCFPIYEDLKNELKSGCIGEPKHVIASFGNNVYGEVPRLAKKELGGGCLLDLGCYPVQFAQLVFNHEKPKKITATGLLNKDSGVDDMICATLEYSNDRMAVLNSSQICTLDQKAVICGDKQAKADNVITIENMWCPTTMTTPRKTHSHPVPKSKMTFNFLHSEGLSYEAESVRQCLLKGWKENPLITLDQSLQLHEIMDEILRQVGVVYEAGK